MVNMHPSRRQKGCGLCKPWKSNGYGRSYKDPFNVSRQQGKQARRTRGWIEDDS